MPIISLEVGTQYLFARNYEALNNATVEKISQNLWRIDPTLFSKRLGLAENVIQALTDLGACSNDTLRMIAEGYPGGIEAFAYAHTKDLGLKAMDDFLFKRLGNEPEIVYVKADNSLLALNKKWTKKAKRNLELFLDEQKVSCVRDSILHQMIYR